MWLLVHRTYTSVELIKRPRLTICLAVHLCRFVHPDDRRQEALVMRWVGRNRQDAPIVRDIRMIRPVWKIDGLANKHMPIADDSRDPPVKYQQQCHTAHIQLLAETKGVYPDPRGGDTSVWGDDVVAPYEDLMVSSHDGFTLTLDRQAFPVAMMCDSAPTASDVSPHTASSRPGSISVALDTSARLGGSSGGTSAGSAGMGERGQRGGSGVEDHSRNSAHAADASDWLASAEMVESPLLCMPDSNNSHDVDGTFIASEAGIVADIGAAPSASVLRLPVPGGREASPSTHIPTPTSSGSAAGGLPSEVMEFEPDGATPHDHAVYSRLLRATLHQALSSTQQAALEYMHERLAGFEVIAQRFVCFPEYDDAGVLQAETRYCVGWTPVAEEVVDVQTATSRLLE